MINNRHFYYHPWPSVCSFALLCRLPSSEMPTIPKNNLHERMLKLGYDPKLMEIKPPVLDNSQVVKEPTEQPKPSQYQPKTEQTHISTANTLQLGTFNIDEWSDFEEDE